MDVRWAALVFMLGFAVGHAIARRMSIPLREAHFDTMGEAVSPSKTYALKPAERRRVTVSASGAEEQ